MHHYIYQITNNVNGKIYIGKHRTNNLDDGYFGSGKLLKRAIEKYGKENFSKEILFTFDSEEELNAKEKELVTEEFCLLETNYNLCVGGQGGFSYINREGIRAPIAQHHYDSLKLAVDAFAAKRITDPEFNAQWRDNISKTKKEYFKTNPGYFSGLSHTEETRQKMAETRKGRGTGKTNSQFGTMWINNGSVNRKVKRENSIEPGWKPGRIVSKLNKAL